MKISTLIHACRSVMLYGSPLWTAAFLYVLWLIADAVTAAWELTAILSRIDASPLSVPCFRCGAPPFVPCSGMRYEVHAARDAELRRVRK